MTWKGTSPTPVTQASKSSKLHHRIPLLNWRQKSSFEMCFASQHPTFQALGAKHVSNPESRMANPMYAWFCKTILDSGCLVLQACRLTRSATVTALGHTVGVAPLTRTHHPVTLLGTTCRPLKPSRTSFLRCMCVCACVRVCVRVCECVFFCFWFLFVCVCVFSPLLRRSNSLPRTVLVVQWTTLPQHSPSVGERNCSAKCEVADLV